MINGFSNQKKLSSRSRPFCPIVTGIVLMVLLSNVSAQGSMNKEWSFHENALNVNMAIGMLHGESKEYVYDDENQIKLSQLNWTIRSTPVVKGEFSYDVVPWLTANVNGWVSLTEGQARMDDYDWLIPSQRGWSDWSHHDNTDLKHANAVDLNLRGWILQAPQYQLGLMTGYQRNVFSFLAKGGCYQYNNGQLIGCFPQNESGIGYKQIFKTAYLGVAGNILMNRFEFGGLVKFGPWVASSDVDHHYQRNLLFKEHGDHSRYYSVQLTGGYFIKENLKMMAEIRYDQFTNGTADTEIFEPETNEYAYLKNSAGLSNHHYIAAIGLHYTVPVT